MNQGEPRKGAGRPFPSEGREGAWTGGRIPSCQMMLGHGVRSRDGQERLLVRAMAGQATGLGASGRIKYEAGRDLLPGGGRRDLFSAA